jgi:hypothetical protein
LLSAFSIATFLFQLLHKDEFGDVFRDQPGAWPHLLGHLLRGGVGAGLAWCLWKYLQAVKKTINAAPRATPELFQSLARWWTILAISVIALLLYGAWVTFVTGPPRLTRALSPWFQAAPPDQSSVRVEFRLAETEPPEEPAEELIEATVAGTSRRIFLHKDALVTNQDITEARVVLNDRNKPAILVRFAQSAQPKLREATEAHRGKPLAILVDGRVVTAPIVKWRIGESAEIEAGFSREEAERIAKGLAGKE